jgi:hypothetical protein
MRLALRKQVFDSVDLDAQARPVGQVLVLAVEQIDLDPIAFDDRQLGGLGIPVQEHESQVVPIKPDALFDIGRWYQWGDTAKC